MFYSQYNIYNSVLPYLYSIDNTGVLLPLQEVCENGFKKSKPKRDSGLFSIKYW
jgi:hypothetical protein